jgi:hypothetical protein
MYKTSLIVILSCLLSINLIDAQKLKVVNVEELRSITASWDYCKVEVKPIGDDIRNYTYYKINDLKRAVDNKGINLLPESMEDAKYVSIDDNSIIQLLKASRSASTINIDGSLSLFKPTEENGGIVKISGFKTKAGVNLAPKGAAFSLFFYDKPTLQKMGTKDVNQRYEDIQKLPESDRNFASEVNSLVDNLSYYTETEIDNMIFFAIGGDNSQVMGVDFEDDKGKKITPVSSSYTDVVYTYYFETKPDAKMKVILNVESQKAIKKVPFSLLGVDLP